MWYLVWALFMAFICSFTVLSGVKAELSGTQAFRSSGKPER